MTYSVFGGTLNVIQPSRAWYRSNRLREFRQIFTLGAVGDKDELIRFWGQKVKGLRHSEAKYVEMSTLGHFLNLSQWLITRPRDTYDIFKVIDSKSRSQVTFPAEACLSIKYKLTVVNKNTQKVLHKKSENLVHQARD